MFIRQTRTNNKATGEGYFTFRLVRGERIAGKVRQITVLNLGRHFPIKQDDWPLLCCRLEQLLQPQETLLTIECSDHIESAAQRYYGQLIARAPVVGKATSTDSTAVETPAAEVLAQDFQDVDINSLKQTQPRSVGVEHVALHALSELGFIKKLAALGVNEGMRAAIVGNLIGRMAHPASELATWNWLQAHSALGELLDVDFEGMSHMQLYRASDMLMRHRTEIEDHLFSSIQTLFTLEETVTLYDLTNTYFEGEMVGNRKAKRGRSKEKRSDCPLVTLGLVLDGSGFVRRSKTFDGNVTEGTTLEVMLKSLSAPPGAMVIMDAGIATEENLAWLTGHNYRYLVVRRGGVRQFDETRAVTIKSAGGEPLQLQKEISEDGKELRLYCHSEGRDVKETAMVKRFSDAFEAGLNKIAEGLNKPRTEKGYDKLLERIGRLKQKSRGVSQHYTVTLVAEEPKEPEATPDAPSSGATQKVPDESTEQKDGLATKVDGATPVSCEASVKKATALTWKKAPIPGTMATHPGVYCLRSNETTWDEERLWRTYTMLTDLESVFRSLKGEMGLRPVFHSKENRGDGHLFITVLAYQFVQVLRVKLKAAGVQGSWATLRDTLSSQERVTASLRRKDGLTVHVRQSTVAEPPLMAIYKALAINPAPGGIKKLIS